MAYQMTPPPTDPAMLSSYLRDELQKLQEELGQGVERQQFIVLHAAPNRPREGDMANADGTDWAPTTLGGLHYYNGSTWKRIDLA